LVVCVAPVAAQPKRARRLIAPAPAQQTVHARNTSLQATIDGACDGVHPATVVLAPGRTIVSASVKVPSNCTIQDPGIRTAEIFLAAGVNDYVFTNSD